LGLGKGNESLVLAVVGFDEILGGFAVEARLDILRFSTVSSATTRVVCEDGNVSPRSGAPVRVVVTFFSAFITITISVFVLAGEDGGVTALQVAVSSEQAEVATTLLAVAIVSIGFVTTELRVGVSGHVFGDTVSGFTIAEEGVAHVLENDFAVEVRVAATVLVSPFDVHDGTFIEVHVTEVIATTVVVLGIEHAVGIVTIAVTFVSTIVATTRELEVDVSRDYCCQEQQDGDLLHSSAFERATQYLVTS